MAEFRTKSVFTVHPEEQRGEITATPVNYGSTFAWSCSLLQRYSREVVLIR